MPQKFLPYVLFYLFCQAAVLMAYLMVPRHFGSMALFYRVYEVLYAGFCLFGFVVTVAILVTDFRARLRKRRLAVVTDVMES